MSEIDSMKKVEEALEPLDEAAKKRVLDWACSRYLGQQAITPDTPLNTGSIKSGGGKKKAAKKKPKTKSMPKQIKNLNLNPSGKQSAKEFSLEKKPSNARQKCVVAVYYLRDIIGEPSVTTDHVFTYFKTAGWPIPTDLVNTLQQAGSTGWLDTADALNILITPIGENLIEHDLPKPVK